MKRKGSITKVWLLLLWGVAAGLSGRAQTAQPPQTTQPIVLHGLIKDSTTHAPLSNASIAIKGLHGGVRTNAEGRFHLTTNQHALDITVTNIGYNAFLLHLDSVPAREVVISLSRNFNQLSAATVRNKKQKYRNKDNPAVELIRKVIENKAKNRMEGYPYASYEKYEKLQVSVDKATDSKAAKNKLLKPNHFLVENGDTSKLEGRTLSLSTSKKPFRMSITGKSRQRQKTVVLGKKKVDFGEFFDMRGISAFLNRLYQDFNVYDNNISVFTNLFLSPIADGGPTFYEYYIQDTVMLDSQKLVRLSFRPRNPNDFLFRGTMWVTLDGNYSIQKLRLLISKSINFNLVRDMKIDQDFEKMPNGRFLLSKSDVLADFGITAEMPGDFWRANRFF